MDYDVLVLGSGPGGYVCAIRAAQRGARVAVVEARELGGVCLNRGCIPTKVLTECIHLLRYARRGAEYGVACGDVKPDFAGMSKRKEAVCDRLRKGIESLLKKHKIELIAGFGKLTVPHTLSVKSDDKTVSVTAQNIVIATGSEPARPAAFPFDEKTVITSDGALKLEKIPESVLIVGGGYIGAEWADVFAGLGSKVTIVEMMDQLLPRQDPDIATEILRAFKKQRMDIYLKTKVEAVKVADGKATCKLSSGEEIVAEKVLVSIGRKVLSAGIGLEEAGVKTDRGAIVIDEHCRTNVPSVYAIGDVTGKLMLAHVATRQGLVAAECATGGRAEMDYRVVPACVFTTPEVATVGRTKAECEQAGIKVKEARFPFMALGKAQAIGETTGWVKIFADEKTGEVLGVHIVGAHASSLIAEAALAMKMQATVEEIADTIHAHPTMPEAIAEAAEAWMGLGIHF